jgi:hypothetical protein
VLFEQLRPKLPSIETVCGTLEGLAMSIVTSPALALSLSVSNSSAPPGSAAMSSFSVSTKPKLMHRVGGEFVIGCHRWKTALRPARPKPGQ